MKVLNNLMVCRRLARVVLKCCITVLKTWENISPMGLSGLKPLKNRSGQSIQNEEANFTALFQFPELLCPRLRYVRNEARVFGVGTCCPIVFKVETFNEIGIFSSVAVVWFLFHLRDVIVMGANIFRTETRSVAKK